MHESPPLSIHEGADIGARVAGGRRRSGTPWGVSKAAAHELISPFFCFLSARSEEEEEEEAVSSIGSERECYLRLMIRLCRVE